MKMPKYLVTADYKSRGTLGVVKEGGSGRREAVKHAIEAMGGKLEAFYFAYGHVDAYVICDIPDANSAIALSLAVNGSGAVVVNTIPLITPEDVDAAAKKAVSYRAPGAPSAAKGKGKK
jgi:uncharacterized protein with GYD domain